MIAAGTEQGLEALIQKIITTHSPEASSVTVADGIYGNTNLHTGAHKENSNGSGKGLAGREKASKRTLSNRGANTIPLSYHDESRPIYYTEKSSEALANQMAKLGTPNTPSSKMDRKGKENENTTNVVLDKKSPSVFTSPNSTTPTSKRVKYSTRTLTPFPSKQAPTKVSPDSDGENNIHNNDNESDINDSPYKNYLPHYAKPTASTIAKQKPKLSPSPSPAKTPTRNRASTTPTPTPTSTPPRKHFTTPPTPTSSPSKFAPARKPRMSHGNTKATPPSPLKLSRSASTTPTKLPSHLFSAQTPVPLSKMSRTSPTFGELTDSHKNMFNSDGSVRGFAVRNSGRV